MCVVFILFIEHLECDQSSKDRVLLLTIWRCGDQFSKDMSTLLTILSVVTSYRKTRVSYWLSVGVVTMQISKDRLFCFYLFFICFVVFCFVLCCFY